jgi:hypothetical protein
MSYTNKYNLRKPVCGETGWGELINGNTDDIDTLIYDLSGSMGLTQTAPLSSNSHGNIGDFRWDSDYLYVCTSVNVWKRTKLENW